MKTLRLITLVLCALALGLAFAHAMELPAKMSYEPGLYLHLVHTLYRNFGRVGGFIEVGAVVTTSILAYRVRDRGSVFYQSLTAALLFLAAHAIFWIFIAPMNAQFASWTPTSIPPHWIGVRNQWEYTHALRALLMLLGFGFLAGSILTETASEKTAPSRRWWLVPRHQ